MSKSSVHIMNTLKSYKAPTTKQDVIKMLSDRSNKEYQIFRDRPADHVKTIAVGKKMF